MINSVVLISGVQQSDSFIHIHASILFQILFSFKLLHNIEQSSLCYTVGPWLSILNIVVCTRTHFLLNNFIHSNVFTHRQFHNDFINKNKLKSI